MNKTSRDITTARKHLIGCNVTTCPDEKCKCTGICQRQASEKTVEAVKEIVRDGSEPAPKQRRVLIAFTGLAGSGKTTAALYLVQNSGFRRTRFAEPLKAMMRALGCTEAEIEGDRKELPSELLGGATPRHAMQTLGNEWGRELVFSELWVSAWQKSISEHAGPIALDDCRYPNEAAAIKTAGGIIVKIERKNAIGATHSHVSENHALPFDLVIQNDGTEAELFNSIDTVVQDWSWAEAALND